jgi:filamentous hemagglutinin
LFPGSRAEEGQQNPYEGDLTLAFSRLYTLAGGDISIAVPGGLINVGLANPPASIQQRPASELGIVAQRLGNVHIFTNDDVLVNQSRVFTLLGGNIAIWSTNGDIDAGRGSKSSVSAPPPAVLVDPSGRVTLDFSGAVAGSGIRTISTEESIEPGDVDLIAPHGVVNAGDAGIGAGRNLNIAAEQVIGLDNIQVGGVSTGVPPETSGLGASLYAVSAVAASSASASTSSVEETDENQEAQATLAQTALSWLEVFVVGIGEENCKPSDVECLKRQPLK